MCICLWPKFDCPEVTLCGWQDIKIQLLLLPTELHPVGGGGGGGGGGGALFFLISAKAECNKVKQFQYGWDREVNTTCHPFCDWTIFNVTGKLGNRIKGIFTHILCEPNEIFTLLMSF